MFARVLPLIVPLALFAGTMGAGCGDGPPAYTVELASSSERAAKPRFIVRQPGNPGTPWYMGVTLWDDLGQYRWRSDWQGAGRHAADVLSYGAQPSGWATTIQPTPLRPGETYLLEISGAGQGFCRFQVDADGLLRQSD